MIRQRKNSSYWHKGVIVLIYLCITVYSADKQELDESPSETVITTNILTDPVISTPLSSPTSIDVSTKFYHICIYKIRKLHNHLSFGITLDFYD